MALVKYCAPCRQDRPITEFNKHKKTYDGLTGVCKTCYQQRYGRNAIPQRSIANPDPLDRKFSRESNSIKFLEAMLLIYGDDIYCIDKTMKAMAEDTNTPERTVHRYLPILVKLGLLRRTYSDLNDRSKGYKWWVCMNKPEGRDFKTVR